ncbi:MAG: hypothetical protein KGZ83_09435 [Sulfuricella sp.]|nr:hypothetical protein [Sulfuricella sp.]
MSPNTLRAQLSFSFKGETHELDAVVDLDNYPADPEQTPDFHVLLARVGGIDTYSYLYEVLESHDVEFSDATGLAAQCCDGGGFNWKKFAQARREDGDWQMVRRIAEPLLPSPALDDDPALKAALLAVYRAGKTGG